MRSGSWRVPNRGVIGALEIRILVPECLRSGVNGFLFDPANPQSIAQQVSKWLALSRTELAMFGENSLQIARTCFDPAAVVPTFLEEILEASGEGARYLQSAAALG